LTNIPLQKIDVSYDISALSFAVLSRKNNVETLV